MASKVERLRAKMRNMRKGAERTARNVLHAGETLVVGGGTAYLEGRMSDDNGEWGYKNVPYAYMGGGVLLLSGLLASATVSSDERDYSADLFASGAGMVGGHLFRSLYESGVSAKQNKTTGNPRRAINQGSIPMGLHASMRQPVSEQFGTVFDGMKVQR